ncbi:uncharacterized protein [Oscarella lobularis]|uniref:uncharacterized protein n=1 Tax=Oscarella lobularis TaxID=121494 RepID=UPI003313C664
MAGFKLERENIALGDKLGRGAFGDVYRASMASSEYAAKVVAFEPNENHDGEARIMAKLNHPNVVRFYGFVSDDKGVILLTELVKGGDLHTLLFCPDQPMLTDKDKVAIAVQTCAGLIYLHKNDVIHFDIKSSNILVALPQVCAKICDMGISRLCAKTCYTMKHRRGTYQYSSPEIFNPDEKVTKATDIWSLGAVMTELFGDSEVWSDATAQQIIGAIQGGYNRPPRGPTTAHLPPKVRGIVEKCFTFEVSNRPNAEDVMRDLQQLSRLSHKRLHVRISEDE